jgi:hypothetical protein
MRTKSPTAFEDACGVANCAEDTDVHIRPRILAHHLILSSYGFWLANDPRGSGSSELREKKFDDLGPIHPGRKSIQPTKAVLRAFYTEAFPRLDHAPLWFDAGTRDVIGRAFAEVIERQRYTVWACFIGSNHAHLCVRYHRDKYETIWSNLTGQSRVLLVAGGVIGEMHPVWGQRPYSVYLHTPEDIRRVVGYIADNPEKEGLPPQKWGFVKEYGG